MEYGRIPSVARVPLSEKVYRVLMDSIVGLNPKCRFCGFMLEDEGVFGSCHIGIGTSITLGGMVKASCHYDVIMKNGTVVADGKILMENGVVKL